MKWLAALNVSALLLCFVAPAEAQFQSVRVQVIDRGQGDGMLIRTPNSQWVVIDAGTNRQQAISSQTVNGFRSFGTKLPGLG